MYLKKILCILLTFMLIISTFISCGSNKENSPNQTQQTEFKSQIIYEDNSVRITYVGNSVDESTKNKALDIVLENLSDQVLWFECLEAKANGSAMDTMLAEVLEPETVVEARILILASEKISLSNVSGTITVYSPDNSYQENINFEIY